jgi:GT2 family glycosyltransferase
MKRSQYIDNIQFSEENGKLHIYIVGWYTGGRKDDHCFHLFVNGKEVPCETERTDRYDIARNRGFSSGKRLGFCLRSDISDYEQITSLQIKCENVGNVELLLEMNGKNVKYIIAHTAIEYNIDQAFIINPKGRGKKLKVTGWAVGHGGDLQMNFTNRAGEQIAYKIQKFNRVDLHMRGFTEDPKEKVGFEVELETDQEDAILNLSVGKYKEAVDVFSEISKQRKAQRIDHVKQFIKISTPRNIGYLVKYGCKNGLHELREEAYRMITNGEESQAKIYEYWFAHHKATKDQLDEQARHKFEFEPMVSIIVPTYNTPIKYLKEMIDSVIHQSYYNWQLCIADGSGGNKELEKVLKQYSQSDGRVKYQILEKNLGIAGNTNAALAMADGDIIGLLDHDDTLEPDALYEVINCFQDSEVDAVYTDEDKILGPDWRNVEPHFKPDFNLDLIRSNNYITHFFCVKKSIISQVGGFKVKYDGAQDYDVILRCYELSNKVAHVARILYHWRMHPNSTAANPESKSYCHVAGQRAIQDHLDRVGVKGEVFMSDVFCTYRVKYERTGDPLISIIIPNMDHTSDLKVCIDSIMEKSTYKNLEIIVVENNSTLKETFDYYDDVQKQYSNVKIVTWEKEFNYSAINNFGVQLSNGEYVLLLNNDTELINPDSIEDMLANCMRKEVGIVGAKLFYDDDTVQHAGVILGFGGVAGHAEVGIDKHDPGYFARAFLNCDYSAVTAACLMISRKLYDEVGGFTEEYAVAFNDVDFCMKVREKGYLIVYDAYSQWYHYESKSRGLDDTAEKMERFKSEVDRFQIKWKKQLDEGDPYYNKNFSLTSGVFKLDRQ